jgi:hypothetical protein
MQIHARHILAALQSLRSHAALADDGLHVEVPHDIGLIRLFTDAGRRAGGHEAIFFRVEPGDHRPAVIDRAAVEQRFQRFVDFQIVALRLA